VGLWECEYEKLLHVRAVSLPAGRNSMQHGTNIAWNNGCRNFSVEHSVLEPPFCSVVVFATAEE